MCWALCIDQHSEASCGSNFAWGLTSVNAGFQERQTRFTVESVKWLRQNYRQGATHMPVVLVGHSMGGVVARAAAVALASDPTYGKHNAGD